MIPGMGSDRLGQECESEIRSIPQVWRTLAGSLRVASAEAAAALASGPVVLLGCGSGYLAARFGQVLLDRAGLPALAETSSDYLLRPLRQRPGGASGGKPVAVALSRSGATSETLSAVRAFRARHGGLVISVTCRPGSALARESDLTIDLSVADEAAVPQTRSVSSIWLTLLLVAGVLANTDHRDAIVGAAEQLDRAADGIWSVLGEAASSGDGQVLLGSGLGHILAAEAVLKLTEMGRVPAWAHRILEFRHGPVEALRPGITLVGPFGDDIAAAERAAIEEAAAKTDRWVDIGGVVPRTTGPTAILLQLYAAHAYALLLARRHGHDADRPTQIRAYVDDVWLADQA